jgi:hypothetical protein
VRSYDCAMTRLVAALLALTAAFALSPASASLSSGQAHVWELQEIILQARQDYANPYTDVTCWIDLEGPGFAKRVYGFWDGGRTFRVRFVAIAPGDWRWRTGSNHPEDAGLSGGTGALKAVAWSAAEIAANPNRRGFVRATANGRALQYADGTPFFILGDTWLAASTWRLPMKGSVTMTEPGPGIGFEDAIAYRRRQGFNSISFIAAFPNWAADGNGATFADSNGVNIRNAWEKFGTWAPNAKIKTADGATTTAKNMEDEQGNIPFAIVPDHDGMADFDRIDPAYFRSLDRKMRHLSDQGFVPMFEPVRRDTGPSWKAYFDFNTSYARTIAYLEARYGAFNLLFSGIHLDWVTKDFGLTGPEYNAALTYWLKTYGTLPFGQPVTALIDGSTYRVFGHGAKVPWLTMHTVGNKPRNHGIYPLMEESFRLDPPYPLSNMEPYYTGWNHQINRPGGETPVPDSERDNYFARAMMYGSVLSGGLAGHVHGTAAYDVTSTGEPSGWRPYIWEALRYKSAGQMQFLRDFVLSEGARYRDLLLASEDLHPRKTPQAPDNGLDGWSYMMRTADRRFALVYFEWQTARPHLEGMLPGTEYRWLWFDPLTGRWSRAITVTADAKGKLHAPPFPKGVAAKDWAAKLLAP